MSALAKTIPLTRESIFNGIVLYEPIDTALLNKVINSDLLLENYQDQARKQYYENEKTHLLNYQRNIKKNLARVEYKRTKGFEIGRFNPVASLGLHTIHRQTRHTIANGLLRDIDIENCHNVILYQILKHNEYKGEYDMLIDYCNNREKWREEIITAYDLENNKFAKFPTEDKRYKKPKELAKNLIIRILYGGGLNRWKEAWEVKEAPTPTKVSRIIRESQKIQKWVCANNPELFKKCKEHNLNKVIYIKDKKTGEIIKTNKDYNHEGTTTSWFLQEKECLVLEEMYKYMIYNGYIKDDICALCNDGIMIQDKYYKPELLDELQVHTQQSTGLVLKFEEKPLSEGYENIIDKHIIFDLWNRDGNDGMYADYFKVLYSEEFVVRYECLYTYNKVYWERSEAKVWKKISSKIDGDFKEYILKRAFAVRKEMKKDESDYEEKKFLEKDENNILKVIPTDEVLKKLKEKWGNISLQTPEGKDPVLYYLKFKIDQVLRYIKDTEKYLRCVTTRDKLVKDCVRVLSNDWIEFDSNGLLLAFENKIYDLEYGKFITPRHDQYISLTTGWKWTHGYDPNNKQELMRILDTIFPIKEERDFYLQTLSTGIYGKVIQHFFVAKGVGGNGKSVINGLMMKCVGNYGYKLPSSAVSQPIKEGANPSIANANNKRFLLFQEPDRAKRICCSTIKEITGDKTLNCRTLYSADTETRLKGTLLGEFNDLPQLDESGDAIGRRLMVQVFSSRFLTHAQYDELNEEQKNTGLYHLANPYYTGDEFQERYKQALMGLLMEHFKIFQSHNYTLKPPKSVVKEADEYMKYSDDLYGWFNDKFKREEGKFMPFKEVFQVFSYSSYYTNMTKVDKRKYTAKYLKNVLFANQFLKKSCKFKGTTYKGEKLTADSIVGYRWREEGEQDDYDEDAETIVIH
jgi:phage/plasmid-associated DNA primase